MPVERRGQAIRVMVNLANWQQEEPTGCGGGRQLSMDGTSRVTGDCHARFCERLGVKFPEQSASLPRPRVWARWTSKRLSSTLKTSDGTKTIRGSRSQRPPIEPALSRALFRRLQPQSDFQSEQDSTGFSR